jgi:hypothetical protein
VLPVTSAKGNSRGAVLTGRWNRYDTVPAGRSNASVAARTAEPIARRQIKPYLLSTSGESPSRYQIPCILSPRGEEAAPPLPPALTPSFFASPHGQTGAHEPVSGLPERAILVRHWLILGLTRTGILAGRPQNSALGAPVWRRGTDTPSIHANGRICGKPAAEALPRASDLQGNHRSWGERC